MNRILPSLWLTFSIFFSGCIGGEPAQVYDLPPAQGSGTLEGTGTWVIEGEHHGFHLYHQNITGLTVESINVTVEMGDPQGGDGVLYVSSPFVSRGGPLLRLPDFGVTYIRHYPEGPSTMGYSQEEFADATSISLLVYAETPSDLRVSVDLGGDGTRAWTPVAWASATQRTAQVSQEPVELSMPVATGDVVFSFTGGDSFCGPARRPLDLDIPGFSGLQVDEEREDGSRSPFRGTLGGVALEDGVAKARVSYDGPDGHHISALVKMGSEIPAWLREHAGVELGGAVRFLEPWPDDLFVPGAHPCP